MINNQIYEKDICCVGDKSLSLDCNFLEDPYDAQHDIIVLLILSPFHMMTFNMKISFGRLSIQVVHPSLPLIC